MDPIALAAGTAVVSAMATDAWLQARTATVALWRRVRPEQAAGVESELAEVRTEVLAARAAGDPEAEAGLAGEWQNRLRRLLQADPGLGVELRRLLDEELTPVLSAPEQTRVT